MKNVYTLLKEYDPSIESNADLATCEVSEPFSEGLEIRFNEPISGLELVLYNKVFTLSSTTNGIKRSYNFVENQRLRTQAITLADENKKVEFYYSDEDNCWRDAFLKVKEEIITQFSIMKAEDDPDDFIHYNDQIAEESKHISLAFDKRLFRWSSAHESYDNSHLVSEIMCHSQGIIREDMSTEIVCEMFQITKEQLAEIPLLLVAKSSFTPK